MGWTRMLWHLYPKCPSWGCLHRYRHLAAGVRRPIFPPAGQYAEGKQKRWKQFGTWAPSQAEREAQLIPNFPQGGRKSQFSELSKSARTKFWGLDSRKLQIRSPLSALERENTNNTNTNKISNRRRPEKTRENAVASSTPRRARTRRGRRHYVWGRMRGVAREPAGGWAPGSPPLRILGPAGLWRLHCGRCTPRYVHLRERIWLGLA